MSEIVSTNFRMSGFSPLLLRRKSPPTPSSLRFWSAIAAPGWFSHHESPELTRSSTQFCRSCGVDSNGGHCHCVSLGSGIFVGDDVGHKLFGCVGAFVLERLS